MVVWLVPCRLMVKQERRPTSPVRRRPRTSASGAEQDRPRPPRARDDPGLDDAASPTPPPCRPRSPIDPTLWDPLPVTLPTYVTKPAAARRTVRTIDLDDSGVWTSGRTEGDAAIAREADGRRPGRAHAGRDDAREAEPRAVGS